MEDLRKGMTESDVIMALGKPPGKYNTIPVEIGCELVDVDDEESMVFIGAIKGYCIKHWTDDEGVLSIAFDRRNEVKYFRFAENRQRPTNPITRFVGQWLDFFCPPQ
jgi:hypothetical protein